MTGTVSQWSTPRVIPTGSTFTVVARRGSCILRVEKLTAEQVAAFDPHVHWARPAPGPVTLDVDSMVESVRSRHLRGG
jgi:hypothetical protein